MRVLITGASGYIGSAVAKAFRQAGHYVYGLIRSEKAALLLQKEGIEPLVSDLSQPQVFASAARSSNVLVHCAFENSGDGVKKDARVIEALIGYAREQQVHKMLIYTSGTWVYGSTSNRPADESTVLKPIDFVRWRPRHEEMVLRASSPSISSVVIRPGIVYGKQGGLTALWFEAAEKGSIFSLWKWLKSFSYDSC
ncbi:MAG: NAD-dependent epimerase/dehydratase family protein [Parachlamydiaceae bacterium]